MEGRPRLAELAEDHLQQLSQVCGTQPASEKYNILQNITEFLNGQTLGNSHFS